MNRIDGICVPVSEDDGDERAIAQMKTDRDSDYLYLRGKEIDQGSIMYKMEDYSDGIFEVLQSAKYADGTELDEKELDQYHKFIPKIKELESTQELIDWVMIDFVSESAVQEDDCWINYRCTKTCQRDNGIAQESFCTTMYSEKIYDNAIWQKL